jgi:hypothetical protein
MKDTYFNLPAEKGSRLVNFFQTDSTGAIKKQASVFGGALDMNYPLKKLITSRRWWFGINHS